jgi:RimJ/RimL family protein N-acetyltransferase
MGKDDFNMMKIVGEKIMLRDFIESDIADRLRWETINTEWKQWDAPWEHEGAGSFDVRIYARNVRRKINKNKNSNRLRDVMQICVNDEKKSHIGWLSFYYTDKNFNYSRFGKNLTIGISIPELGARHKGYATEAWSLYIDYLQKNGVKEIYTQTWSGNFRVIGLMKKLGFVERLRKKNIRFVRGFYYDGLTFILRK